VKVTIYVEGGGDSKELHRRCRQAFSTLLEKAGFGGRLPRIIACGSRNEAFDDFRTAIRDKNAYAILLVDSEDVVKSAPWEHLAARDSWTRPDGTHDDQAQLMVTCMETWIVADRDAVRQEFRPYLTESALPPTSNLERRTKEDVQRRLESATKSAPKRKRYEKGRKSFQIVEKLTPETLAGLLPHFQRLIATLDQRL
jgi:hypothetical protein